MGRSLPPVKGSAPAFLGDHESDCSLALSFLPSTDELAEPWDASQTRCVAILGAQGRTRSHVFVQTWLRPAVGATAVVYLE